MHNRRPYNQMPRASLRSAYSINVQSRSHAHVITHRLVDPLILRVCSLIKRGADDLDRNSVRSYVTSFGAPKSPQTNSTSISP